MKHSNHVLACAVLLGVSSTLNAEVSTLVDTNDLLNAELISARATVGGLKSIKYFPFDRKFRIDTRFADLTCDFQDGTGQIVDGPVDDPDSFRLVIDHIDFAENEEDPNVDAQGINVRRDYPVAASGSVNLLFFQDTDGSFDVFLDLCTSDQGCGGEASAPRLACREAGVLVFRDPFG